MTGEHVPILVRWDLQRPNPALVCDTCSNQTSGLWVPASFCIIAAPKVDTPERPYVHGIVREEC